MKWEKRGLVFCADGSSTWAKTHAMLPTPMLVDSATLRIYVAFLDANGVGRIGFVDIDPTDPSRTLKVSDRPVLDIGAPGTFDDNGVVPSCVVKLGRLVYLYYCGFQLGVKARYYIFAGLATSDDGGSSFKRYSQVPILERTNEDLFFRTAPFVSKEDGKWRMWYIGGGEWTQVAGKSVPVYRMKYLESLDGLRWNGQAIVCLDFDSSDEHGFGRTFVMRDGARYKMIYSVRKRSLRGYRLGYAESTDGVSWIRKDHEVGIDVSSDGWDSTMICFASLYNTDNKSYLFYNGNDFGRTGFGYALLRE